MIKRCIVPVILLAILHVAGVAALEIDRAELFDIPEADIEFENYEGPVEQLDSRDAIRGIGRFLGEGVKSAGAANYGERYRARRIIGDREDPLRAADILELTDDARVDHIVNLRRIISGYLEAAWDYEVTDADLLSRFITIYNAVHRGNLDFFTTRYRRAVIAGLNNDIVGFAISYRQWPGGTQLVIPIRDDRVPGDLDAVDPRQLIDRDVITELRSRTDMGIQDRKAIIEFIERVIEERAAAIEEERTAIAEEQAEIDRRREEIAAESEVAVPSDEEQASEPPAQSAERSSPQREVQISAAPEDGVVADQQPEVDVEEVTTDDEVPPGETAVQSDEQTRADEQEDLDRREEELDQRREGLAEEEEELQQLTEEVEKLYQETAEDQALPDDAQSGGERVIFVLATDDGTFELAVVDSVTLELAGEQTIPLATRETISYRGGVVAVRASDGRLLFLDGSSLEIRAESDVRVVSGARIRIVDQSVVTVISQNGRYYIGQFDPQLVLERRSSHTVHMNTDIVESSDGLIVQDAAGVLRRLELEDM